MSRKVGEVDLAENKRLLAKVRHSQIAEITRQRSFIHVTELASEFGVSEMTIRRDLIELEREGILVRTHGGAVAASDTPQQAVVDREEPAFAARLRENYTEKRQIAAVAASLVEPRMSIALDVGTTTHLLAMSLSGVTNTKFFTTSLRTALVLGEAGRDVYVPPGQIRGEEMSICGKAACEEFERLWFDIAFIGVSGITCDGLYDYSPDDSDMKRVYLERAKRKVLLCDSAKYNHMSLIKVAELTKVDLLISDKPPPPAIGSVLSSANVAFKIAPRLA